MTLSLLGISNDELDDLKDELAAVLDIYRGKDSSGSEIDTLELTKAQTCVDLSLAADFDEYVENYEPASVDFLFDYDGVGQVRIRVSTFNGSIWFRTSVPEEVIDYVYAALRKVKGL